MGGVKRPCIAGVPALIAIFLCGHCEAAGVTRSTVKAISEFQGTMTTNSSLLCQRTCARTGCRKRSDSVVMARRSPATSMLQLRGGSSTNVNPFVGRTTPSLKPRPSQSVVPPTRHSTASEDSRQEDEESVSTKEMIDSFLTRDSRNSFIARVYAILSIQLVVTAASCLVFGLHPTLSNLAHLSSAEGNGSILASIPLFGILTSTVAWFRVCSSTDTRRVAPQKWWWLGIFTVGEALAIGFMSSLYKFRSVVTAMFATAVASGSVSLYTIWQSNPNFDLTQFGGTLSSWAMIHLVYLVMGLLQYAGVIPEGFFPYSDMLASLAGACLFSAFLSYHTKLIVAGKHSKYRMGDKDYILGAMALYTDIVNIFLNMLQMLGEEKQ